MGRRKKRARLLARRSALLGTTEAAPVVEQAPVVVETAPVAEEPVVVAAPVVEEPVVVEAPKPAVKKTTRARKAAAPAEEQRQRRLQIKNNIVSFNVTPSSSKVRGFLFVLSLFTTTRRLYECPQTYNLSRKLAQ